MATDKPTGPELQRPSLGQRRLCSRPAESQNKTKMSKIALFNSRSPHLHTGHLVSLSNGTSLPMTIHPSFLGWSSHIFPIVEFPHPPGRAPPLGGSPILLGSPTSTHKDSHHQLRTKTASYCKSSRLKMKPPRFPEPIHLLPPFRRLTRAGLHLSPFLPFYLLTLAQLHIPTACDLVLNTTNHTPLSLHPISATRPHPASLLPCMPCMPWTPG